MSTQDDEALARQLQEQENANAGMNWNHGGNTAQQENAGMDWNHGGNTAQQANAGMGWNPNSDTAQQDDGQKDYPQYVPSIFAPPAPAPAPDIVVQGQPVGSNPYQPQTVQGQPIGSSPYPPQPTATFTSSYPTVEVDQPHVIPTRQSKCQDALFAPLFYLAIVAIAVVAGIFGNDAFENSTNPLSDEYAGYLKSSSIAVIFGLIWSVLGLGATMSMPQLMIQTALIFSVVLAGFMTVFAFMSGNIFMAMLMLMFFGITVCYAYAVWSRIPFATVNLVTGISSIKANGGIVGVALVFVVVAAAWSLLWAVAMLGIFDRVYGCDGQNDCTIAGSGWFTLFLLFIAYFFVHQVLQNTIHVSIAGIVATWWIAPEEGQSCCSPAVTDSLKRSFTTSFGSICFGSLLVAIVQALRALANTARSQDDGILLCLAECILACIEGLLEYFNKWAFIYVGIYGMGYCESGKAVMTLFENRGWEAIIADDLVGNVLLLVSLLAGALTGVVSILVELAFGWFEEDTPGNPHLVAFLVGFIVGLVLCSTIMSTIGSSVNAVLVLFAEKPSEFQTNHPELSRNMREKWSEIYPGSV